MGYLTNTSTTPSTDSSEDHYCTESEIMYNVTLRGGITSGRFRDRGKVPTVKECAEVSTWVMFKIVKWCIFALTGSISYSVDISSWSKQCKKGTKGRSAFLSDGRRPPSNAGYSILEQILRLWSYIIVLKVVRDHSSRKTCYQKTWRPRVFVYHPRCYSPVCKKGLLIRSINLWLTYNFSSHSLDLLYCQGMRPSIHVEEPMFLRLLLQPITLRCRQSQIVSVWSNYSIHLCQNDKRSERNKATKWETQL